MERQAPSCPDCQLLRQQLTEQEREIEDLRAQIAELTRHDRLTGALNRRSLVELLEAELQRARRTGHPFCFAVIGLDRFGQINDRYGHAAGDRVLKTVSDSAVALLRVLDRFGRLGGDEFGVLLPTTWLDQGMIAMTRLRKAIDGCDWQSIAPGLVPGFSVGITTNSVKDTAESMLERAAKALAQAKQEGGNRTVQIEEDLPDMPPLPED
ncbi:GGDEF domain-containing protein [Noviherbaspirillum massiliense]|uniref:GGDEF domain-containing protein n=1 Tax=Noviherbaspirillum massiliense TaxID=1465823 RepID=UPI0002FCCAC6|nr:GGDEF domain-containing protein [Noviherbaspirillum massiliense]